MAQSILLINGPNLNLLGTREPQHYGSTTLSDVENELSTLSASHSPPVIFSHYQSNHEGAIIDRIHETRTASPPVDAIIINAGGLTHTSVALRDALVAVEIPFIEVHVSNVHAREEFRHASFLSEKAVGVIVGLGTYGYRAAFEYCVKDLKVKPRK